MRKKLTSILLSLILAISLCPGLALAEDQTDTAQPESQTIAETTPESASNNQQEKPEDDTAETDALQSGGSINESNNDPINEREPEETDNTGEGVNDEDSDVEEPNAIPIEEADVRLQSEYSYAGSEIKPCPTVTIDGNELQLSRDYNLEYLNNINAGMATVTLIGTGDYCGSISRTFTIKPISIAKATATLKYSSLTYTGVARKDPVSSVILGGNNLTSGSDYTVNYANNINVGTAKATITGKGNYTGSISKTFTIKPASIANANMSLSFSSCTYNGNARKPTVSASMTLNGNKVTLASKTSASNSKVKITYASGRTNVGTYKVTISGTGNYTGSVSKTFKINPTTTYVSSLSSSIGGFTAKWAKRTTQTSGYQIRYSASSSMSNAKTTTISSTSTASKKYTGLYQDKRYYVQVRTYKTIGSTKYYSAWSPVKGVTTRYYVYTTRTGSKYHRSWCSSLRKSKYQTTISSARSRGYSACKICEP